MKINLKQISFSLLLVLVLIQAYINFCVPEKKIIKEKSLEENKEEVDNYSIEPQTYVQTVESEHENKKEKNMLFDKYGKPSHISEKDGVRIYIWNIENPKPWSLVVNDSSLKFPLIYGFKYNIGKKIKKLKKWKEVIPNIEYKNDILYIPSKDEESSLALLNLILSNIDDELLFEEIINNNLIPISVKKIKSHRLVKNKILEQIMDKIKTKPEVDDVEYKTDLADTENKDLEAYGGGEFTFL